MDSNLHNFFQNYKEIDAYCRKAFEDSGVDYASVVQEARRQLLEYAQTKGPNYIRRNFMPDNMYCNVVGLLYDRYPDLMFEDQENCAYLKLAQDIRVYPKKLNDKYLPGNIITNHVKSKYGQELFNDDTKIHVLYAGFVLEKEDWMLDFKGVYASYINDYYPKKAAFIIDLDDMAKPQILGVEEVQPQGPQKPLVWIPQRDSDTEKKAQ